jgi:hypothetical protein
LEVGVLDGIALSGSMGAVSRLAVGFDDHTLLAPDEIALVSLNAHVHLGPREAAATTQREKDLLELRARPGAAGPVNGEH